MPSRDDFLDKASAHLNNISIPSNERYEKILKRDFTLLIKSIKKCKAIKYMNGVHDIIKIFIYSETPIKKHLGQWMYKKVLKLHEDDGKKVTNNFEIFWKELKNCIQLSNKRLLNEYDYTHIKGPQQSMFFYNMYACNKIYRTYLVYACSILIVSTC